MLSLFKRLGADRFGWKDESPHKPKMRRRWNRIWKHAARRRMNLWKEEGEASE